MIFIILFLFFLSSMRLKGAILSILFASAVASAEAAFLHNGDFESPPSNLKPNSSSTPLIPLSRNNTIPGWSFNGTVSYVTASPNISLPGNGHAVQLGQDGVISQAFRLTSLGSNYILTFTLAPSSVECVGFTALAVSVQPLSPSLVFFYQGNYGRETWETHACYLGSWGGEGLTQVLELLSQPEENNDSLACRPIVDTVILQRLEPHYGYVIANQEGNGGFEMGPLFVSNSDEGIILEETDDFMQSAVLQWAVSGTVKYIDSKHFLVPEGNAAVEILSVPGGVHTEMLTEEGSEYHLEFIIGVSDRSCRGLLVVGVQAGSGNENFTMLSNGTESTYTQKAAMSFKADSNVTSVSIMSFQRGETSDLTFCGPVIDNVVFSDAFRVERGLKRVIMVSSLILLAIIKVNCKI